MSKFNEVREDMRLAYLNHGSYRFFFRAISILKGLLTLAVLACFGIGIWYLTYGFDNSPNRLANIPAEFEDHASQAELTIEQVAVLKDFALKNRKPPRGTSEADGDSAKWVAESVAVHEAPKAVELAAAMPPDTEIVENISFEDSIWALFDNLERKLGKRESTDAPSPLVPSTDPERAPLSTQSKIAVPPAPVVADPRDAEPTIELPVQQKQQERFDEVKDGEWLLAQSADSFLIQIASTPNHPFLVQFEKQLPSERPSAIFEMLIGDQSEHVLTYGIFESREHADQSLGSLTQVVRKYGAYVRRVGRLHKQIRDLGAGLELAQQ